MLRHISGAMNSSFCCVNSLSDTDSSILAQIPIVPYGDLYLWYTHVLTFYGYVKTIVLPTLTMVVLSLQAMIMKLPQFLEGQSR